MMTVYTKYRSCSTRCRYYCSNISVSSIIALFSCAFIVYILFFDTPTSENIFAVKSQMLKKQTKQFKQRVNTFLGRIGDNQNKMTGGNSFPNGIPLQSDKLENDAADVYQDSPRVIEFDKTWFERVEGHIRDVGENRNGVSDGAYIRTMDEQPKHFMDQNYIRPDTEDQFEQILEQRLQEEKNLLQSGPSEDLMYMKGRYADGQDKKIAVGTMDTLEKTDTDIKAYNEDTLGVIAYGNNVDDIAVVDNVDVDSNLDDRNLGDRNLDDRALTMGDVLKELNGNAYKFGAKTGASKARENVGSEAGSGQGGIFKLPAATRVQDYLNKGAIKKHLAGFNHHDKSTTTVKPSTSSPEYDGDDNNSDNDGKWDDNDGTDEDNDNDVVDGVGEGIDGEKEETEAINTNVIILDKELVDAGNVINEPGDVNVINEPSHVNVINEPGHVNVINEVGGGNVINEPGHVNVINEPGDVNVINEVGGGNVINEPGDVNVINEVGGGNVINDSPTGEIDDGNDNAIVRNLDETAIIEHAHEETRQKDMKKNVEDIEHVDTVETPLESADDFGKDLDENTNDNDDFGKDVADQVAQGNEKPFLNIDQKQIQNEIEKALLGGNWNQMLRKDENPLLNGNQNEVVDHREDRPLFSSDFETQNQQNPSAVRSPVDPSNLPVQPFLNDPGNKIDETLRYPNNPSNQLLFHGDAMGGLVDRNSGRGHERNHVQGPSAYNKQATGKKVTRVPATETTKGASTTTKETTSEEEVNAKVPGLTDRGQRKAEMLGRTDILASDRKCKSRLPSVIIIGVMKAGTEAFSTFLAMNPQVAMSLNTRSTLFFSSAYDKGLAWYRDQMMCSTADQVTMEKAPQYFPASKAPERIAQMDPDIKLILMVRNPIDRAVSHFLQVKSAHPEEVRDQTFEDVVFTSHGAVRTDSKYTNLSRYVVIFRRWLQYFSLDQILIVDGDDFKENQIKWLSETESFIGVRHFITKSKFVYNEEKGFYCIRTGDRPGDLACLGSGKGRSHPPISPKNLTTLKQYFKPFNEQFFKLVEQRFDW